jgi:hypothetical protein
LILRTYDLCTRALPTPLSGKVHILQSLPHAESRMSGIPSAQQFCQSTAGAARPG